MLRFINKEVCPPNGFRYFVKETGVKFHSWTWRHLLEQVHAHLKANNLPIPPNWEQIVEDYACSGMGPDVCEELDPRWGWVAGAAAAFKVILAGTKTLGSWALAGLEPVAQEKAEARSEVCAGCFLNRPITGCAPCNWPVLHALVRSIIGDRTTKSADKLHACAACGCDLKTKVFTPIEHIKKSFDYGDKLPENCWVLKETEGING